MSTRENASDMSVQEHVLRYDIARIIYDADWEIEGTLSDRVRDIDEHYLVDEDKVVEAIIAAIREANRR